VNEFTTTRRSGRLAYDPVEVELPRGVLGGGDVERLRRAAAGLHLVAGHVPQRRPLRVRDVDVAAPRDDEVVQEAAGAGLEGRDRLLGLEVVDGDRAGRAAGHVELAALDLEAHGVLAGPARA
jgi:hypothetical protein